MYYTFETTVPTKIESIDDYDTRLNEIIYGQMGNVFLKERFMTPFFWVFAILFIPLSVAYLVICVAEILVDTILLPISCAPKIRGIAFIISSIVWGLGAAVGIMALVPLTYDVARNVDTTKKIVEEARSPENLEVLRRAVVSDYMDIAQNMYIHYAFRARFNDDRGILNEAYNKLLKDYEAQRGISFYNSGVELNNARLMSIATTMYYLFDLNVLERPQKEVVVDVAKIIRSENLKPASFFDLSSWFEVRVTLIERIKNI